jgi:hypothetical protein
MTGESNQLLRFSEIPLSFLLLLILAAVLHSFH